MNPKAAVIDKVAELQAELDRRRNLPLTLLGRRKRCGFTGGFSRKIQQEVSWILFTDLADTIF